MGAWIVLTRRGDSSRWIAITATLTRAEALEVVKVERKMFPSAEVTVGLLTEVVEYGADGCR